MPKRNDSGAIDSQAYAADGACGSPRTTTGVASSDMAEARGAHGEFRKALMQNVDGYEFEDNVGDGSMWNMNDWIGELGFNPAVSEKQRKMMAADYSRAKSGKKTRTGMSPGKLKEFMAKPKGGY